MQSKTAVALDIKNDLSVCYSHVGYVACPQLTFAQLTDIEARVTRVLTSVQEYRTLLSGNAHP